MARYLVRRCLLMVPVAFGAVTLVFLLMHITPGDPALAYLGPKSGPEALAALRHKWGLDKPLVNQYFDFLRSVVTLDFGESLKFQNTPIKTLLAPRIPQTLSLIGLAAVFAVILAVPLGIVAAMRKDKETDWLARVINAVCLGMPVFVIGYLLIILLSVKAGLFPVGGFGKTASGHIHSLILPALTIGLTIVPPLAKAVRSAMVEALDSEYVAYATSKGLSRRVVVGKYALRNSLVGAISVLGINIGWLCGGTVAVEKVFGLSQGLGITLLDGVLGRDFPVVQVCALVFAGVVMLVFLLTDIAYSLVDPRVRLR
ncbi:MAG: ABC transporter permease [Bifidobacteriaceae bacterium]|nr:ABC transporter permease [Bifidobacteriaceae bacterium]